MASCVGRTRWAFILSVALTLGGTTVRAQNGMAGRGAIAGTVFDSLVTNAPLAGAEVSVDGTALTAISDGAGRFRIDGVAAGRAVLRFYHAALDSLGFGAAPAAVSVAESGAVEVRLATPSPATLYAHFCPAPQPQSTGVLLGRVRNVDGREPLAAADVMVRWGEWTVGGGALSRTERRATTRADAGGAYALCGVPTDIPVVARATGSGHVTGLVEVDFSRRLFDVRDFTISLSDSGATTSALARLDSLTQLGDSVSAAGSASIVGTVRGPDAKPIADAQVSLLGFPSSVRTNGDGVFGIVGVPAGSQTIDVRAVGFQPQRRTFDLATGERRTVMISAARAAQTLTAVNIVGRGARVDMTGFEERRKAGLGRFIGPEEIERRRVFDTSQLLWNIPGSRVIWNGSENVVVFTRPNGTGVGGSGYNTVCNPAVFIDGYQVFDINDVRPYDVRAIEVYNDQSAAPPMYRATSLKDPGRPNQHCAVVLVWTKPRPPKRPNKR